MSTGKLAKPVMRGLLHRQIRRNLILLAGVTILAGTSVRVFLANPRKETYKEFYKNYNIDQEFDEMRQKGVFQSAPPE